MRWSKAIPDFYRHHRLELTLPAGVEVLYPYNAPGTQRVMKAFYQKYYDDAGPRTLIIGINPGRFGAGVTGLPFTDPIRLAQEAGIAHEWDMRPELSSVFVYQVIRNFGGLESFYRSFYITSVSPLGYTRQGKNLNYYDDPLLQQALMPYIRRSMQQQLAWKVNRKVAFCLGEGKNFAFLQKLNDQEAWFEAIEPLPHPRFIMQYKRRQVDAYVDHYLEAFARHGIGPGK